MPVPSTAGWLMLSLKPNCSRPSGGTCTSSAQIGATPGRSRTASWASVTRVSMRAVSRASAATTRCTSFEPSGVSQFSGAFSPTSPM